jgi:hypothetical protein
MIAVIREIALSNMVRARIASKSVFIILGIIASLPIKAADEPNEAVVNAWIAGAIEPKKRPPERDGAIGRTMKPTGVMIAWQRLKRCRDSGNSQDLSLAAAEHYLFGRFVAGENGDTRYRDLPDLYESVKSAAIKLGAERAMQTTPEPVSPVNKKVTEWGKKGVEKGLEDYEAWSGQKPGPGVAAWATVLGVTTYKYARYALPGETGQPRCDVRLQ